MKKITKNILLVFIALVFSQCYTEVIEEVTEIPYDAIERKLEELRDLQAQVNETGVESVDLQAKINALVTEINNFIPPTPPNIDPIAYSIGIVSAVRETGVIGVSGAIVSIDIGGTRTTSTTDTDGQAIFNDMRQGVVMVHVEAPGYTDVSFVVDLIGTSLSNVTSTIALYPTTAANGAVTIDGVLQYDPIRTDDLLPADPGYGIVGYNTFLGDEPSYEPAAYLAQEVGLPDPGTPSQRPLDAQVQSWQRIDQAVNVFGFVQPNAADYGYVASGTPGNILIAIYEEMFVTTASDPTDGSFQLVLPARSDVAGGANNFRIQFEEFSGSETYNRNEDWTNFPTVPEVFAYTTRTRTVTFVALYGKLDMGGTAGIINFNPGSPFDPTLVNYFADDFNSKGANTSLKGDFYFGARTISE